MDADRVCRYGYHGVVLFFVVSGYLITRILIEADQNALPLSAFYIRRFLRIWPLMLVVIGLGCLLRPQYASSAIYNLLLVNNYAMAVDIEPVFRTDVMWSLAIEEQFYLLWPLVLLAAPRRLILPILFCAILAGFLFDSGILYGGRMIMHKSTHGAMQYIALGCVIAFGLKGLWTALTAGAVFLLLLSLGDASPPRNLPWQAWYGLTWLLFALVYVTVHHRTIIRSEFLAHVGKLCYGLYLLHFFMSAGALYLFGRSAVLGPAFYCVASYAAALLSFYVIEKPALSVRAHFEYSRQWQAALMLAILGTTIVCLVLLTVRAGNA